MDGYYQALVPWVFGGLAVAGIGLLLWIGHIL